MLGDLTPLHISIMTYEFLIKVLVQTNDTPTAAVDNQLLTLQSLMLLTTWLYSLLKVCVIRRRHCNRAEVWLIRNQSSCDESLTQSELPPSPLSPLWPAPSRDRPGSLCRLSRSHCSRWVWWHFQRWCWRSVRKWMWRWTGSPSSCLATAAHSGIWWRALD